MVSLDYVDGVYYNQQRDIMAFEGINSRGINYVAYRISDGKKIQETFWDLSDKVLYIGHDFGTLPELREKGHIFKDIFQAALADRQLVRPVDLVNERI